MIFSRVCESEAKFWESELLVVVVVLAGLGELGWGKEVRIVFRKDGMLD